MSETKIKPLLIINSGDMGLEEFEAYVKVIEEMADDYYSIIPEYKGTKIKVVNATAKNIKIDKKFYSLDEIRKALNVPVPESDENGQEMAK